MTSWQLVVVLLVSATGAFIQGSVGFGHNLVAAPILALVDERFVPGPAIASAAVLTALMAYRDRRDLHLGEIRIAVVGRIPATILAAVTVALLPAEPLAILFAALVLVAVGITAFGPQLRPTRRNLLVAGALSGYMGTATSIGGPPMAMLYAGEHGRRLRGTLAGFFLIGIVLSLSALAVTGSFGREEVLLSALPVPGVVVGFLSSGVGTRWLDAGRTRPAVLVVSALAACRWWPRRCSDAAGRNGDLPAGRSADREREGCRSPHRRSRRWRAKRSRELGGFASGRHRLVESSPLNEANLSGNRRKSRR
jgi:uncharacterized membrane protein YfcA